MADGVLIWGAGAIGGTLGAYWSRAGIDVTMVDIVAEHAAICSGGGLAIEGPVEAFTQVVRTVTPDQLTGRFDRVVLAVKAHHTAGALDLLLPHLSETGFVLSAQNGLNELLIAEKAGPKRTMGAFVNFGADWLEPGRILFGNRAAVVVGEIDGSVRPCTRDMHELLKIFEPDAVLTDNIWGYLWGKMGYGAMLFATALTHESMSENFADPERRPALAGLAREVVSIAIAEGVDPLGFNGYEPDAFAPGADDGLAEASLDALAEFNSKTAKTHSGIYRDLAVRHRATEVDAQIGVIVEIARKKSIATPLLAKLVELIHDVETGARPISGETYAELSQICPRI